MLTVQESGRIRRAHRDGMSIREIARKFHRSRYKVREVLHGEGEPQRYRRRETPNSLKLAMMVDRIREILKVDESAPPKQRHTAIRRSSQIHKPADGRAGLRMGTEERSCWVTSFTKLRFLVIMHF